MPSPLLGITDLAVGSTSAYDIYNTAVRLLEAAGGGFVAGLQDRTVSTPPGAPATGDIYHIPLAPAATGLWLGHEGEFAQWDGGLWQFFPVRAGMGSTSAVPGTDARYWTGAAWAAAT